jgi:thioredoxin-related protein
MSKALEKAKATGKYIFMDFYTDYCPPCKIMDKEVFGDRDLANYLNTNFINVKVNAGVTSGANTASLYDVRAYPTLIFADSRGNMIMRKEGGTSISTVKYMAEEVLRATAMK